MVNIKRRLVMEIITLVHFRHTVHVFHAIIFPKFQSPFFSYSEHLTALCPVESVDVHQGLDTGLVAVLPQLRAENLEICFL